MDSTWLQEENAEGLHLIDFEQLKIENQSLAEKIEERNDELARLRAKTSQVMQILAHIKEKLHAVAKDNQVLQVCITPSQLLPESNGASLR